MAVLPYLVAYLTAGILLACGFLINQRRSHKHRFLNALVITVLWPFFAIAAPDIFSKPNNDNLVIDEQDPLESKLIALINEQTDELEKNFVNKLRLTADKGERSVAYIRAPEDISKVLDAFWDENIPPSLFYKMRSERAALEESEPEPRTRLLCRHADPDWYLGFSNEFMKCIAKIDGKLRGRVLDAIGKLSTAPTNVVGDTVKPLTNNLSGLWRYRIGDDRLVYLPDHSTKKITLLYFGARADVYRKVGA